MPHKISAYKNNKCMVLKHDTDLNLALIHGKKICLFKETFANLKSLLKHSNRSGTKYAVNLRIAVTQWQVIKVVKK